MHTDILADNKSFFMNHYRESQIYDVDMEHRMDEECARTDINAISAVYAKIHTTEEKGETTTGWKRGIYPERDTAIAALKRDDLFVSQL